MTAKKKYANFSASYADNAKDAGINNTYIPETWKVFFTAAKTNVGRVSANSSQPLGGTTLGRFQDTSIRSSIKHSGLSGLILKKAAKKTSKKVSKKAAPKKALKKAAPKKALKKAATRK